MTGAEQQIATSVLVIGTGGSGLRTAIELAEQGIAVLVVGKRPKADAHTTLAAGGINAALATMDAEDTWQLAMLDAGDFDGAAALLIARLRDPEKRYEALGEVQEYLPLPRLPKQVEALARWEKLVTREDVAAVINEVGRRERVPIYDVPD